MIKPMRLPVLAIFFAFLLLCISAAYWGMQMFKPPVRNVLVPMAVARADAPLSAAVGLFGGGGTSVVAASNFQLKGVVVAANARESVAIIAADGKPAQAIWINGEIQPGVTVKEVNRQYVLLSDGGVTRRVELPKNAGPAAGLEAPLPVQTMPAGMPNDFNPGMQQQAPPPAPMPPQAPASMGPGTGPRPN